MRNTRKIDDVSKTKIAYLDISSGCDTLFFIRRLLWNKIESPPTKSNSKRQRELSRIRTIRLPKRKKEFCTKRASNKPKKCKKEKRKGVLQFIKYAFCAASAGIIQLALFSILQAVIPQSGKTIRFIVEDMDLVTFISTTVALCASILWNFTFNRKFTFKDAGNVPKAMLLAFLFYVPFYPFQTWYVHTIKSLLVDAIGVDGAGIIAEGTVMIINFALEFMWQKFVVFRKRKEKKEEA